MKTPTVGMGVTISWVTDRHAGTILKVSKTGAKITIQEDKAIRTDNNGMSDCQTYSYERDPDGIVREAWQQGDGSYRTTGGQSVTLGVRRAYFDYSF